MDEKAKTVLYGFFFEILNKFKCLENKLWVVQGREC